MLVTSVPLVSPEGFTVDPHCVRVGGVHGFVVVSLSGRVAGSPAPVHEIPRLDDSTFDQLCAMHGMARKRIARTEKNLFMGSMHRKRKFIPLIRRRGYIRWSEGSGRSRRIISCSRDTRARPVGRIQVEGKAAAD